MQQVADKINFQDPVQKYAECHSWDMSNSNATKYHEIKVGILDNTCFKENVPTFEILVGWILRLGLNFCVINVALYGWKCDPAYLRANNATYAHAQGSDRTRWSQKVTLSSKAIKLALVFSPWWWSFTILIVDLYFKYLSMIIMIIRLSLSLHCDRHDCHFI